MEEIVKRGPVPEMPEDVWIRYANQEFNTGEDTEIKDLSKAGIQALVEKVRNGTYQSLFLARNEHGEIEESYFQLESAKGGGLIFLQICEEEEQTAYACFDPDRLESDLF